MEELLKHIKTVDGYEASEPKVEGMLLEADYGLDKRREVSELQYPLCCVGAVVSDGKGTGCLIGKNLVLTCAHNCYDRVPGKNIIILNFIQTSIDNMSQRMAMLLRMFIMIRNMNKKMLIHFKSTWLF
jgi:V8-like Glu-specific endopeptidase